MCVGTEGSRGGRYSVLVSCILRRVCVLCGEKRERGKQNAYSSSFTTHAHLSPSLFPSMQPHPPPYNVTELTVKTALFTGGQDWLADPTDVANLIPKIKDVIFYHKNISYYDHLDFIWGLDAATQVYSEIITQINNML